MRLRHVLLLLLLTLQIFYHHAVWKKLRRLYQVASGSGDRDRDRARAPLDPPPATEQAGADAYPAHALSATDHVIPLPSLTRSSEGRDAISCVGGLVPVLDSVLPLSVTHPPGRRIPKVVHVTSRSRCVTPAVLDHLEQWRRTANHSFFFHDDAAVRRLLGQGWVDRTFRTGRGANETCPGSAAAPTGPLRGGLYRGFVRREGCSWEPSYLPDRPASEVALKCATAGATLADLWRYAVLWRYGGIYSDIDNGKGPKWRDDIIRDDDDFVGFMEELELIGQYWLAASPGHPYLRHTMDDALSHLRVSPNVMRNEPHVTTGPGAVKRGFCFFMEAGGEPRRTKMAAGKYVGDENRSITVIGRHGPRAQREYVNRFGLGKEKSNYFKTANMTHFIEEKVERRPSLWISCEEHLKRTEGQPGKKANYVFNAGAKKYVEMP